MKNWLKKPANLILLLILLAYCVYAGVFIYESSFVVDGTRYFVLFDDAMISMRFARNLANGDGLVWNPGGERVEGFSNPLWVGFMALFHLFPIPSTQISLWIQVSSVAFYVASLVLVKLIADELTDQPIVGLLAVFLTAFYGQLNTWVALGMEVCVAVLITNIAVLWGLRMMKAGSTPPGTAAGAGSGRFSPWLYVLLGASTLVRIDMGVVAVAVIGFLAWADAKNRRKHLLWGIGMLAAFVLGQTLLRLWYYGAPLPNTYYLKVTGAPTLLVIFRGFYVFVKFLWNFNLNLFLLPFVVILIKREKSTLLLAWVLAAMCAYSVYVGGDAWEEKGGANRFISTALPLFFVLFAYSLELIRQALLSHQLPNVNLRRWAVWLSHAAVVVFAFVGLVNFNALLDTSSLKFWLLLKRHQFVPGSERYVRISAVLNDITTEDATVAVVTAGIIPYFAERPTLDLMGKCDKVVAQGPMHIPEEIDWIEFRPGHMKWDYAYSLGELQPDVVAQLWDGYDNPTTLQYLANYTKVEIDGLPFFLRNDSPYILWDQIP